MAALALFSGYWSTFDRQVALDGRRRRYKCSGRVTRLVVGGTRVLAGKPEYGVEQDRDGTWRVLDPGRQPRLLGQTVTLMQGDWLA